MFAYCENDPVNRSDPSGESWNTISNWFSRAWNRVKNWANCIFGAGSSVVYQSSLEKELSPPPLNYVVTVKTGITESTCSGEIEEIIYGSESCLVVYSDSNGTFKDCVFIKSGANYKLPTCFSLSKVAHVFTQNGLFNTYQVNGTSDYYVQGSAPTLEGEEIGVFNGDGSKINTNVFRIDHTGFVYFHLSSFQDDYYLMFSGKTQPLS